MHWLDWLVVGGYLVWIVWDGLRRTEGGDKVEGYLLANRSLPWWAVGLSVMATQLSAITLVGTTGQGYRDGMKFVQFYFGLPIAMLILSVTVVPFFYRAGVYTAYEYLERRFDVKTRTLTSALFLLSRGLQCGVIIAAPAVILSIVLGWNLTLTVLAIGLPTALYTMVGGVQAVTWTDVKQMAVIIGGVLAAVVMLIAGLPDSVTVAHALTVAGATGRLTSIDFTFNLTDTYTFWSGMIGGTFLMLSYFGCDQSQVQRYLTAKSVSDGRRSLLMSAYVKIPLQALILLTGVLVFVYYLFVQPPMLFNPVHDTALKTGPHKEEYATLERRFSRAFTDRREAATAYAATQRTGNPVPIGLMRQRFQAAEGQIRVIRSQAVELVKKASGDTAYNDVNYVFPTFVTTQMPPGLIGLIIAAIFAAAMSSIAAELNSLSTATLIDFYKRHLKPEATDKHYMTVSWISTAVWGVIACGVAIFATNLGSLIEVVNRFGSFFYGSLLGVFVLAIGTKRATGTGAFIGLIAGMSAVAFVAIRYPAISFLWHNVVGVVVVVVVGMTISPMTRPGSRVQAAGIG
ncbi:MAG: sodium:solute symporter [Vicinamibacteria bacterium]|nr:sodium:solute symporter [Vicinamibacteria bacterium]